jgi:hypothetical protein
MYINIYKYFTSKRFNSLSHLKRRRWRWRVQGMCNIAWNRAKEMAYFRNQFNRNVAFPVSPAFLVFLSILLACHTFLIRDGRRESECFYQEHRLIAAEHRGKHFSSVATMGSHFRAATPSQDWL